MCTHWITIWSVYVNLLNGNLVVNMDRIAIWVITLKLTQTESEVF